MVTFIAYWKTKFQVCTCTFIEKFKLRRRNIFLVYTNLFLKGMKGQKKIIYVIQRIVCRPRLCLWTKSV